MPDVFFARVARISCVRSAGPGGVEPRLGGAALLRVCALAAAPLVRRPAGGPQVRARIWGLGPGALAGEPLVRYTAKRSQASRVRWTGW